MTMASPAGKPHQHPARKSNKPGDNDTSSSKPGPARPDKFKSKGIADVVVGKKKRL